MYKIISMITIRKKLLRFLTLGLSIAVLILTIVSFYPLKSSAAESYENLYGLVNNDKYVYINKDGQEVFSLPYNENYVYGLFNEGYVVIAKKTQESSFLCGMGDAWVGSIEIYNNKGELLKTNLPNNITYLPDNNTPMFYNGVLSLILNEPKKGSKLEVCNNATLATLHIDTTGKPVTVAESDVEPYDSYNPLKPTRTYMNIKPYIEYGMLGYKNDDGEVIIYPQFSVANGSDDVTRNNNFYNGVALVCMDDNCNLRRYINTNGEYINDEVYTWAEPFYRELAFVAYGNTYGYINTNGEWVYKVD